MVYLYIHNVGSISEHVLNNKTGFIVENDSEEEIVNKFVKLITQLFSDKALLKQLSDNAYHHAIVNYKMNKFQQEIRRVIHNY
jgi:glycosyltransferase involved in cell wall biosynthesis